MQQPDVLTAARQDLAALPQSDRMSLSLLLASLISAQILPSAAAAVKRSSFDLESREVIEARLRRFSTDNAERERLLKQMFEETGCRSPSLTEEPVSGEILPNLVCSLPGSSHSLILVGAHFDHVKIGQGVVDNWSGASLLPALYSSIRAVQRKHAFTFVGFTDEEGGLIGSKYYAAHLSVSQRSAIRAMINLDSVGLGPTKIFLTHSDRGLFAIFTRLAERMKLRVDVVNVPNADEDSEPFSRRAIPTLMIHSVTPPTWPVLHSARDTLAAIDRGAYYDTYHLLAAYLAELDRCLN